MRILIFWAPTLRGLPLKLLTAVDPQRAELVAGKFLASFPTADSIGESQMT